MCHNQYSATVLDIRTHYSLETPHPPPFNLSAAAKSRSFSAASFYFSFYILNSVLSAHSVSCEVWSWEINGSHEHTALFCIFIHSADSEPVVEPLDVSRRYAGTGGGGGRWRKYDAPCTVINFECSQVNLVDTLCRKMWLSPNSMTCNTGLQDYISGSREYIIVVWQLNPSSAL